MDEQYFPYHGYPAPEEKYQTCYGMEASIGFQMNGGVPLDRQSNASSTSEVSLPSNNCMSTPESPLDNMAATYGYNINSLTPQQYDSSHTGQYFTQIENVKHTPSSLGWTHGTELLKLYTFIVPKGKEPYFQLREKWTPTHETPHTVYLNPPKGFKKNQFPCLYPGKCNGKQNIFGRPADLERHYKNVHADYKDSFPCDYAKCRRSHESFTRKDHYRDHLRDFHKEDIGCAKGEKSPKDKDQQKWKQAQKIWLDERVISRKHWRCVKCLAKNYVAQSKWECSTCKTSCEESRIRARERLAPERLTPEDWSLETIDENAQYSADPPYQTCGTCNTAWIQQYDSSWALCPSCYQPTAREYPYGNTGQDSTGDW